MKAKSHNANAATRHGRLTDGIGSSTVDGSYRFDNTKDYRPTLQESIP
jgi:hypothetical protein